MVRALRITIGLAAFVLLLAFAGTIARFLADLLHSWGLQRIPAHVIAGFLGFFAALALFAAMRALFRR